MGGKFYTLDNFLDWIDLPDAARDVRNMITTIKSLEEVLAERNSTILMLMDEIASLNGELRAYKSKYD
jgi:hypothetical protein